MAQKVIRIGTRDSELALWQAHTVEKKLNDLGYKTEIIAVKSEGDIILDKPLYELGITGIFTKTLDVAMISGQVDIAVHSMKDVPTALPQGIVQAAVLERANTLDILVHKGNLDFLEGSGTIATGSLRRQAQWLNKYPNHQVVDLRGNVNTRMQKLQDNDWSGAVFAAAGLDHQFKTNGFYQFGLDDSRTSARSNGSGCHGRGRVLPRSRIRIERYRNRGVYPHRASIFTPSRRRLYRAHRSLGNL